MKQSIRVNDIYDGKKTIIVPPWVRWMATDMCGSLWFYSVKPRPDQNYQAWTDSDAHMLCMSEFAATVKPPKDWQQELYTWRYNG